MRLKQQKFNISAFTYLTVQILCIFCLVKSMINDHTLYDFAIGKLLPPVIPFMPLLLKGLIMSIHHTSYVYVLWLFRYHVYKWRKWNLHRWFSEFWENGNYFVTVWEYIIERRYSQASSYMCWDEKMSILSHCTFPS